MVSRRELIKFDMLAIISGKVLILHAQDCGGVEAFIRVDLLRKTGFEGGLGERSKESEIHYLQYYMLIFILVGLLACQFNTLKVSEVGSNDWHYKNVGQLTHVVFVKSDRVYFVSEKRVYGSLAKDTGNIVFRNQIGDQRVIGELAQESPFLYFATSHVQRYKFDNHELKTYISMETVKLLEGQIIQVLNLRKREILITTQQIIGFKNKNPYVVGEGRFTGGFAYGDSFVVFSQQNERVCIEKYVEDNQQFLSKNVNCQHRTPLKIERTQNYLVLIYQHHVDTISLEDIRVQKQLSGNLINLLPKSDNIVILDQQRFLYNIKEDIKSEIAVGTVVTETNKGKIIYVTTNGEKQNFEYRLHVNNFKEQSWRPQSQKKILKLWIHEKTEVDIELVVQYEDLQLQFYAASAHERQLQLKWRREESLAYIVDTLFVDFQNQQEFENQYFHDLLENKESNSLIAVPRMFIKRIEFEIKDMISGVRQLVKEVASVLNKINLSNIFTKNPVIKFQANNHYENLYGLRKMLLAVTSRHTIIAIDTKTSHILWKKYLTGDNFVNLGLFKFVIDEVQKVILVQYLPNEHKIKITEINQDNGLLKKLKEIESPQIPRILQPNQNTLAFKWDHQIKYFQIQQKQEKPKRQYIFYSVNDGNNIVGQQIEHDSLTPIWNLQLSPQETIVSIKTSFRNDKQSRLPLFDSVKVYYKNVDFTNFVIITRSGQSVLNLYIVNAKNGHVLLNKVRSDVDFNNEVNVDFDQNTVITTYFNKANKIYQIWVIEQYQQKTETSTVEFIKDYLVYESVNPSNNHKSNIIFEEQIYGIPLMIKSFKVSSSRLSLLKRNVIAITKENQLYLIDRQLLSARRPSSENTFESERLPKYEYLVPVSPNFFLSYNLNLCNLNEIKFSPTSLESTLFTVSYGTDIFLIRSAPQKTFDTITEDFNYIFLVMVVMLVTVGVNLIKRLTLKAKLTRQFL